MVGRVNGTVQSHPRCCFSRSGAPLTERRKEGASLSPPGLQRATDRAGRPTVCCAKARSLSKVRSAVLGDTLPLLLPAQAYTPTPAVTHVSARTMSSEKMFQGWLLSQPRWSGSCSELGPEHLRPSLAPQPSVPLPVPRACLVTGARGVPLRCSAACSGGWRADPTKQVDGRLGADSHCGAQRKDQQLDFSNHSSLGSPPPSAVVNFSALQILSSEKISPVSLLEGRESP